MRQFVRPLAQLLMAVGVSTCVDAPTALSPSRPFNPGARLAFGPAFTRAATETFARLADFGIAYDRVRVVIIRPPAEVVLDTTVAYTPTSPDLPLDLSVTVHQVDEVFDVRLEYRDPQKVLFTGHAPVKAHAPDTPAPPFVPIPIGYVGPGSSVAKVTITPRPASVATTGPTKFAVAATDSAGAAVALVPVAWSVSDGTLGAISSDGTFQPAGRRGTVTVSVKTPTGIGDQVSFGLLLPPAALTLVSGGGQTGVVGAGLPSTAVVQVSAADGVGVAGVAVTFSAPAGGAVSPGSATTDASGRASTSLTLGPKAGAQTFSAIGAGFATAIAATATAGAAASIAAVSGSGQTDTVKHALKAPLVVKVADKFDNPVSGASISWTRTAGTGSVGAGTTTTGTDGQSTNSYTLGTTPGAEAAAASVGGVAGSASFSFTAVTGGAAAIASVSGNGQTGTAGLPLTSAFVVRVTDNAGNPVSGATVSWSASGGTMPGSSSTGADGTSSNTLTLAKLAGPATVTAAIANGQSASFTATGLPGPITKLLFKTQPTSIVAGATMPAVQVWLLDANDNLAPVSNAVTLGLAGGTAGASLSGTLSKAAANGIVSFSDLSVDKSGTAYTLVASATALPSLSSSQFNVTPGPAAKLTLTTQPSSNATSGVALATQPVVQIRDQLGNAVATSTPVTATVSAGSLQGTTPVSSSATTGAATFTDLKIVGPGTVTLSFAATGLTGVTSNAITVVSSGPTDLLLVPASPTSFTFVAGTSPSLPVIKAVDVAGAAQSGVPIHLVLAKPGPTTIATKDTTTGADGTVGLPSSVVPTVAGSYTVTATSSAITGASIAVTLTINPAAASKLIFQSAPSSVTAGASFTATVAVTDAFNNVIPGATNSIAVALNPPSGVTASLGGTTPKDASAGVATFSDLSVNKAASGFTLTATSGSFSATSPSFNVTAAPATQLAFSGVPASVVAGATLGSVAVTTLDQFNNVTPSTGNVSMTLNPSSGNLGGTTTKALSNGVATFTDLTVGVAATGYKLSAAFGAITKLSGAFDVLGASSMSLGGTGTGDNGRQPAGAAVNDSSFVSGTTIALGPRVQLLDASNHAVAISGVTISVDIVDRTPAADHDELQQQGPSARETSMFTLPTLSYASKTTDATGLAKFDDLKITGSVTTYALRFTATLNGSTVTLQTNDFDLKAGKPVSIAPGGDKFSIANIGVATTSFPNSFGVDLFDVSGNRTPNQTVTWTKSTPCASLFAFAGGASPTSSTGNNASTAPMPTMTLTANTTGSCVVTASASYNGAALTNSPLSLALIMRPSSSYITWAGGSWTGGDDVWSNTTNWFLNAVPNSSSAVYIPLATGSSPSPKLTAATAVGSLVLETGAAVVMNTQTLTVNGDLDAGASTATGGLGNGTLKLLGSGAQTVRGVLPTTIVGDPAGCASTVYTLSGAVKSGPLTINCPLTVGANALTTIGGGGLTVTTASGKLVMTSAGGSVDVAGLTTFQGGSHNGSLTDGTLILRGGFTALLLHDLTDVFAPTGSHKTQFAGTAAQHVNMCIPCSNGSQFNNTEFLDGSNVTFDHSANFTGTLTARTSSTVAGATGVVLTANGAVVGEASVDFSGVDSLRVTGTTFPIYSNTSAGKAPKVTHLTPSSTMNVAANGTIAGGLSIQGAVSLNGKALVVKDSFFVGSSGSLDMSNTAGTLTVGGNFTENGGSFHPSSGSLVMLNGTGTQLISFSNASDNFFGSLDITNTSSGGVQLATDAATNGDLRVRASAKLKVAAAKTLTVGPAFTLFLHNNSTIDVAGTVSFGTCTKGTGVTITGAGSSGLSTSCASSGSLP